MYRRFVTLLKATDVARLKRADVPVPSLKPDNVADPAAMPSDRVVFAAATRVPFVG